ncbi:NAD(P)-dependent alcohol dehydrogenase [candidate division KSB1 bacterium]|nr:MAG: NAD(P)-dependent alcohol dehydrogenase [candidate division KSB1 bacterium]
MKVLRLNKDKKFTISDENIPEAKNNEVLLRIKSVGICASDVHYYRDGRIGPTVITDPIIPGHEFSGEIVENGKDVKELKPGMRVAVDPAIPCGKCEFCIEGNTNLCPEIRFCGTPPTDGALREFVAYPENLVFPLPKTISLDEGAILETLGVCLHSIDLGKIKTAWTAGVIGTGPIGLLIIQLSKLSGLKEIYATDLLDYRLSIARKFGADVTLNPQKENVSEKILRLTKSRGVDVVFEAAGSVDTLQQCVEIAKPGGKVIIIGICPEDIIRFKSSTARRKGLTIKLVRRMKNIYPRAISLVEKKLINLKSIITHNFSLYETEKAFKTVKLYENGVIKAIINI